MDNRRYQQRQDPYRADIESGGYQRQGIPLETLNGGYGQPPQGTQRGSGHILEECTKIDGEIDGIDTMIDNLIRVQKRVATDTDTSQGSNRELDRLNEDLMRKYREVVDRVKVIKRNPDHKQNVYRSQVERVERRAQDTIRRLEQADMSYRNLLKESMARQMRIAKKNASPQEIEAALQNPESTEIFTQTLMNSDRSGQSRQATRNVEARTAAIRKIETDLIELHELFLNLNVQVQQQEPVVAQINQQSEVVHENVNQANTQLDGAIQKARAANRKKWYCLGICVLIVIVIVVVILAVEGAMGNLGGHH